MLLAGRKTFILLFLLIFSTYFALSGATNCSRISPESLFVNLTTSYTPSNDEYSYINGTFVALPNENANVHFLCEAHYPIEWVQFYAHEEVGFYKKVVYVERFLTGNFSDTSSYIFQAVVRLFYTGSVCSPSNFTCRSVSNVCRMQKSVISKLGPKREIISFEVKDISKEENRGKLESTLEEENCTAFSYFGNTENSATPQAKCTTAGEKPLQQMFVVCDSAMHCNTYYKHVNKGKKCLKRLPDNYSCYGCGYLSYISYKPGFLICKDNGVVVLAQHYFHSIPQTAKDKPDLYFSWEDADPQKMMLIEPIDYTVYVGQEINVFCQISRYYFSYGHRMALLYRNETMDLKQAEDGERLDRFQANRINITFEVKLELDKVFCFAPVWNSTEWVNQSIKLNISEGSTMPSFRGEETETVKLYIGQKKETIQCVATGVPSPDIELTKQTSSSSADSIILFSSSMIEDEQLPVPPMIDYTREDFLTAIEYTFPEITDEVNGEYVCTAYNFRGIKVRKIIVSVFDGMFLLISTIIIVATLVLTILLVIMGLCWKKIKEQSEEIRLLTEAEVREFIQGNPEAIKGTSYLDTEERIDSLPYNTKFEIPKERLCIDTTSVLGSGAFGQVLKGSVIDDQENGIPLPVAVKTVKQNMELMYFKSLLSEVKIMAHIGKHPNIVSLIGACTLNIRKREIFIAVEFCKNGSLETFLRTFRETGFLNLVKEDEIHIESTLSNPNPHSYQNCKPSRPTISTVHLIKWAREIANGMEYLGSKKIIHGDLAARNVLLSHENVAKIGDFGLSRQLINYSNYFTNQQCPLPWKWMAVEALCDMKFSVHTDVWAYGVTLWECFTLGQAPYPGISWSSEFLDHLINGMRMHKPSYATQKIYDLMLDCWNLTPGERPTFQYLKQVFEEILLEITPQDYFNPNIKTNSKDVAGSSKPEDQDMQGYLLPN